MLIDVDAEVGDETHNDSNVAAMDVDDGSFVLEEETEDHDPVLKKCQSLVEREKHHIAVHTERAAFFQDVSGRVLPSHKPLLYIDSPTSKAKILIDTMQHCVELGKASSMFVPVGARFDFLSVVVNQMKKFFPKRTL